MMKKLLFLSLLILGFIKAYTAIEPKGPVQNTLGNTITATINGKKISYKTAVRITEDPKSNSALGNFVSIYAGKAGEETIAINFYSFKGKTSVKVANYAVSKLSLFSNKGEQVVCPTYAISGKSYLGFKGVVDVIFNDGKTIKGTFSFEARDARTKEVIKITDGTFSATFK